MAAPTTSVFLFTLNCGKLPPFADRFLEGLNSVLPTLDEDVCDADSQSKIPELFVFALQEISSLLDGTRWSVIRSILIHIAKNIVRDLSLRYQVPFSTVGINNFGAVGIIVITPFISKVKEVIKSVDSPAGYFFTSTKGATGLRIRYEVEHGKETEMTFISLHLNAGEGLESLGRRTHDLMDICRGMKFPDGFCVLRPNCHCFLLGDFNYRATGRSLPDIEDELAEPEVIPNIIDQEFDLSRDELTILLKQDRPILSELGESKINFKPTYKFHLGTGKYNSKRIPSWCDRILFVEYQRSANKDLKYQLLEYDSIPALRISDHIPVYLKIRVPFEPPESIINRRGFLIDRSTRLIDPEMQLIPSKLFDFYRLIGKYTDAIFGMTLFATTTPAGRLLLLIIVVLCYLVYRYI